MIDRLGVLKTFLWAAVGVLVVVTWARFSHGLGATTHLSDAVPWGLWIAFDVMGGVALAAGGFVTAAAVYIFGLEKYRPFVRPAILTAFLGYVAVAVGLLYDLGLPWHIWHPIIYPQHHSALFEVAMCVMLYLTVLALEFAPVALEHPLFSRPFFRRLLQVLKKATIPLVIAGIVLSTLHQSSLGSLFLIAPFRVHALWYSPIIYVLFLVSAIALGLMMVAMESLLTGYFFRHPVRGRLLSGLGVAAAMVLTIYAVLRLGDLAWRGVLGAALDGSWQSRWFVFELLVSAVIPATLLTIRRVRTRIGGLALCSALTIFGVLLYRFDVCIIAFARPEGMTYWPSWIELAVSVGIVSGAALVFSFFVENLRVYEVGEHDAEAATVKPSFDPASLHEMAPASVAARRRYSLAFVTAAAVTFALLPDQARFGADPERTPVWRPRTVYGVAHERPDNSGSYFVFADFSKPARQSDATVRLVMIDGNRDGRFVLFPHDRHIEKFGGEQSCRVCHHQNMPFDTETSCQECHADMYEPTDIFDHALHIEKLEGNRGCVRCHADCSAVKTRRTSTACRECHAGMAVSGSRIEVPDEGTTGVAPGYTDVMHRLCIECHKEKRAEQPEAFADAFGRCDGCHGIMDGSDLKASEPYIQTRLLLTETRKTGRP